jgi:membrane protease YdiL (CAAX protease family)
MSSTPTAASPVPAANPPRGVMAIFVGRAGVRAGWRFLAYAVLVVFVGRLVALGMPNSAPNALWSAEGMLRDESVTFVVALVFTSLFAWLEHRPLGTYGFPLRAAFGRRFWEGALWGLIGAALVMLLMAAGGGYRVHGLAIHGAELASRTLMWALAFIGVGLSEELMFRAYPITSLARGMGFWPTAIVLSVGFGALHYFGKPMETWLDGVNVTWAALFLCLTLRRTGDLWFAIGWHFTFDDAQMFLFSGPNTGNLGRPVAGHLLEASFSGPQWLTGGPMGPEASVAMAVMLAASCWLFSRRYRQARFMPER